MNGITRTGLTLVLGAAATLTLPAAALADDTAPSTSSGAQQLSPASPLDLLLSTPGDVVGTVTAPSPI